MMQRDKTVKIGVGGSILEPDKGLIVMETRQPLEVFNSDLGMLGEFPRATDYNFHLLWHFRLT